MVDIKYNRAESCLTIRLKGLRN